MTDHSVSRAYIIAGRVQGVGFRWWAAKQAKELGLAGSVRNLADGSVEVVAIGPDAAVEGLARRLESGPPLARIESVREGDLPAHLHMGSFEIIG